MAEASVKISGEGEGDKKVGENDSGEKKVGAKTSSGESKKAVTKHSSGDSKKAATKPSAATQKSQKTKKGRKNKEAKTSATSDELLNLKKDPKQITAPQDLAGTLQTLFTQTEQQEAERHQKPLRRPKLIYANTFRLWPYKLFNCDKVQLVLDITLEEMLATIKYKPETANDISMKVAERVRNRVLSFKFDRYKIIVMSHVGPLYRQGVHIGMKCLWDPLRDSYVSQNYKNPYIYCNCCVYGIYFE